MKLSKYSAGGNDFVIFFAPEKDNRCQLAKRLCNRNYGVGADGMIVISPKKGYDFQWDFYNSDGTYAAMCGNGSRAACMFAKQTNIIGSNSAKFLTGAGDISARIWVKSEHVSVVETMLPMAKIIKENFHEDGYNWSFYDTGVPHLVAFVENISNFDIDTAKKMRQKYDCNVNFVSITDKICVRTFERGVEGETQACGTGMAACFLSICAQKDIIENNLLKQMTTNGNLLSIDNNEISAKIYPISNEELIYTIRNGRVFTKGSVMHTFDCEFYNI